MKLCVYGLWHLGSVTAACCAGAGVETVGLDPDTAVIANLAKGKPPLLEPGLRELVQKGLKAGKLSFTADTAAAVSKADIIWVAFDTPVDSNDKADVDYVANAVRAIFPHLQNGAAVLVSSQMPVGSVRKLAAEFAAQAKGRVVDFACSPENLRLGKAINVFTQPERIVVGTDSASARQKLEPLLGKFCKNLIWVSVPAAEMTKHAVNAFLATSVTFANEIANLCELVGADAREVERGLRSEPRIGEKAYIRPGAAFAGGTLARDVQFLQAVAAGRDLSTPLLQSIINSNHAHKQWPLRQLARIFGPDWNNLKIALLGLTYKPGTDTLRRSQAVEIGVAIAQKGAKVIAFDPGLRAAPADLPHAITLGGDIEATLKGSDAVILATEWPEFRAVSPDMLAQGMAKPRLIDANGMLAETCKADPRIAYYMVGTAA